MTEDEAHAGEEGLHQADGAEGRAGWVEMDFVLVRTGSQEGQVRKKSHKATVSLLCDTGQGLANFIKGQI